MKDREGNIINLSETPNPHILVLGQSGQGKTYFCCREIEEEIEDGKRILVIDYSGSYTKQELEKNHFKYQKEMIIFEPYRNPLYWLVSGENFEKIIMDLSDCLVSVLDIGSYYQKKWMRKAIEEQMKKYGSFNFSQFIETLERLHTLQKESDEGNDDCVNILHLLSRLSPYRKIKKLFIKRREEDNIMRKNLTIVQLSSYPELERQFLTKLLLALLWKETTEGEENRRCDTIVLDECQFLSLKSGDIFTSILREGRKFGLAVLASTQFLSGYEKTEMETFLQVGNILFFKPSAKEKRFVADIIDTEKRRCWMQQLDKLQVGEAVLKGNYCINSSFKYLYDPIVCKI